jgi:predicted esterase
MEEQRIRRAIRDIEKKLYETRTLISHGDYDRVADALELEALLATLENSLILLVERDLDNFAIDIPEE